MKTKSKAKYDLPKNIDVEWYEEALKVLNSGKLTLSQKTMYTMEISGIIATQREFDRIEKRAEEKAMKKSIKKQTKQMVIKLLEISTLTITQIAKVVDLSEQEVLKIKEKMKK